MNVSFFQFEKFVLELLKLNINVYLFGLTEIINKMTGQTFELIPFATKIKNYKENVINVIKIQLSVIGLQMIHKCIYLTKLRIYHCVLVVIIINYNYINITL